MYDLNELFDEMAFYNGTERSVEKELTELPQHLRQYRVYEEDTDYGY